MSTKTLSTPSITAIGIFDPAEPYDIHFTYADNQSVQNRLVITDPETYETVYDKTVLTMKLQHTVPAETLHAGKCYMASIQVFDADNNQSNLSDGALFYCYTTLVFMLENLPSVCKTQALVYHSPTHRQKAKR